MLIAMACHSTEENQRTPLSTRTILRLFEQLRSGLDCLYVILNGCDEASESEIIQAAKTIGSGYGDHKLDVFTLLSKRNIGTAAAINWAWSFRAHGQVICKMDDDVLVYDNNWIAKAEEAILISMQRGTMPVTDMWANKDGLGSGRQLGILGLKRRDLAEHPNAAGKYRSTINYLPHVPGEHWIPVEFVQENVMGTVTVFNPNLIDKIGGLYQPGLYGYDDSDASLRAYLSGFARGFLVGVDIEHIDPGGSAYSKRKEGEAYRLQQEWHRLAQSYTNGTCSLYRPIAVPVD